MSVLGIRYSDAFHVSADVFKRHGVFNGFVNRDANFYIAPLLVKDSKIPEFINTYDTYKNYFTDIVKILKHSKIANDRFYREAEKRFIFHEIGHFGLGYSKTGKRGSGIGKGFAKTLTNTAIELINAGIEDPEIFELIGLLEEGIGADRISDMFLSITAEDFLKFTERISTEMEIATSNFSYKSKDYMVPHYADQPVIFIPEEFLIGLPVAFDRSDIDSVCSHNKTLRDEVNEILGQVLKTETRISKKTLKYLILNKPELAQKLIGILKSKTEHYNFDEDPKGELVWLDIAENFTNTYPIKVEETLSPFEVAMLICEQFKDLIENNGLFKFFHNKDGGTKNEKFAQMLFFAISKIYCDANDLDISPESDAGRGPVDFKMSRGGSNKANVEIKLSTNPKLLHGYTTQLPIYNKAEKINNGDSIFLIIQLYENHDDRIKKIFDYKNKNETPYNKLPQIVVADATMKKSASKS